MLTFDPKFTEVLYLDVESYVPEPDRVQKLSSMFANPAIRDHFALGAVLCREFPLQKAVSELTHLELEYRR